LKGLKKISFLGLCFFEDSMDYTEDYLLNKRVKILQPCDGYRAAIDAVLMKIKLKMGRIF
jgi:hypothetical protein